MSSFFFIFFSCSNVLLLLFFDSFFIATMQGRSTVSDRNGGFDSSDELAGGGDNGGADSSGDGAGMGPREFKALEGLTPVEARLLVTSLVDDVTASGIGEMLQQQEATKQVGGGGDGGWSEGEVAGVGVVAWGQGRESRWRRKRGGGGRGGGESCLV